jgi:hypothetical protein
MQLFNAEAQMRIQICLYNVMCRHNYVNISTVVFVVVVVLLPTITTFIAGRRRVEKFESMTATEVLRKIKEAKSSILKERRAHTA